MLWKSSRTRRAGAYLLASAIASFLWIGTAAAQGVNSGGPGHPLPPGLFEPVGLDRAPAHVLDQVPENALQNRNRLVRVNFGLMNRSRLRFNLFDDVAFEAVRRRDLAYQVGSRVWQGHVSGDADSEITMATYKDAASATIHLGNRLFMLTPAGNGLHILSELDPTTEFDDDHLHPEEAETDPDDAAGQGAPATANASTIIDIMVVYTPAAAAQVGGDNGAIARASDAVAVTNQAYINSNVDVALNLVHVASVNYTESGSQTTDLYRLTDPDGYIDEVLTWRVQYGADLVSMLTTTSGGVAWVTHSKSHEFSVVSARYAASSYVLAHEVGHNEDFAHNIENASVNGYANYSYGWWIRNASSIYTGRTVMAYNCPGGCSRRAHISNPNVSYNGDATGTATADNARTLTVLKDIIAGHYAPAGPSVPAAPGNLTALSSDFDRIDLNWTDNASDEDDFRIERSLNGVNFSQIATLPANSVNYIDSGLTGDTPYYYRVRARNAGGDSGYSNVASETTLIEPLHVDHLAEADLPVAGDAVAGSYLDTHDFDGAYQTLDDLSADGGGFYEVEHVYPLTVQAGTSHSFWADVRFSAFAGESLQIQYSANSSGPWTSIATTPANGGDWTVVQAALPDTLQGAVYIRFAVTNRTSGEGFSIDVDHLHVRTIVPPAVPPAAPSNLNASVSGAAGEIDLDWQDNAFDETAFEIERSTNGNTWSLAGEVGADVEVFTDSGRNGGSTYSYRVRSKNGDGASGYSNVASETAPSAPSADFDENCSQDRSCTFTDRSSDADGSVWSWSWTFGDGGTSTSPNPVHGYAADGTYTVALTVTDDDGNTGQTSRQVTVSGPSVLPPAVPGNLVAEVTRTGKGKKATKTANLSWSDNSNDEVSFIVERCQITGKGRSKTCVYSVLTTLGAGVTSYADNPGSGSFKYRVKARNGNGDSGYSNEVKI
jgi:PKD repeat protein